MAGRGTECCRGALPHGYIPETPGACEKKKKTMADVVIAERHPGLVQNVARRIARQAPLPAQLAAEELEKLARDSSQ